MKDDNEDTDKNDKDADHSTKKKCQRTNNVDVFLKTDSQYLGT
jgi:hypothetical protein